MSVYLSCKDYTLYTICASEINKRDRMLVISRAKGIEIKEKFKWAYIITFNLFKLCFSHWFIYFDWFQFFATFSRKKNLMKTAWVWRQCDFNGTKRILKSWKRTISHQMKCKKLTFFLPTFTQVWIGRFSAWTWRHLENQRSSKTILSLDISSSALENHAQWNPARCFSNRCRACFRHAQGIPRSWTKWKERNQSRWRKSRKLSVWQTCEKMLGNLICHKIWILKKSCNKKCLRKLTLNLYFALLFYLYCCALRLSFCIMGKWDETEKK